MRYPIWYTVGYAIVNFAEACVILLTLGYWNPGWTLDYTAAYARWKFTRKIKT